MAMANDTVDFKALGEAVLALGSYDIRCAISDIIATLDSADELDRTDEGNRGGFYRDQISVYRQELKKRGAIDWRTCR